MKGINYGLCPRTKYNTKVVQNRKNTSRYYLSVNVCLTQQVHIATTTVGRTLSDVKHVRSVRIQQ